MADAVDLTATDVEAIADAVTDEIEEREEETVREEKEEWNQELIQAELAELRSQLASITEMIQERLPNLPQSSEAMEQEPVTEILIAEPVEEIKEAVQRETKPVFRIL